MDKGEKRKEELINDYEMIQEIMESKNITWENTGIMYTDGSKKKNKGKATGAAFIFEEEDEGYYLSLNKRSSIFTAEVVAIAKGLKKYKKKGNRKENILILSDSMSAIRNIGNNDISAYKNMYVLEVRKRI